MGKKIIMPGNNGIKTEIELDDDEYTLFIDKTREEFRKTRPNESDENLSDNRVIDRVWGGFDRNNEKKETRNVVCSLDDIGEDGELRNRTQLLLSDDSSNVEEEDERHDFQSKYKNLLYALLPNTQATIVYLKDGCGYSYGEICTELGMKYDAVARNYSRSQEKLAEIKSFLSTPDEFFCSDIYSNPTAYVNRKKKLS